MAVPGAADGRGEDGDAAVAFLRVEVGDGRPVVDLAALVDGAGREQDPLGDGGLARVDVGEDAEVADGGERVGDMTVQVGAHGPGLSGSIRTGRRDSRTRRDDPRSGRGETPGAVRPRGGMPHRPVRHRAGGGQTFVTGIRRRPRGRRRAPTKTPGSRRSVTGESTTAVRRRTAGLPSLVKMGARCRGARDRGECTETGMDRETGFPADGAAPGFAPRD